MTFSLKLIHVKAEDASLSNSGKNLSTVCIYFGQNRQQHQKNDAYELKKSREKQQEPSGVLKNTA